MTLGLKIALVAGFIVLQAITVGLVVYITKKSQKKYNEAAKHIMEKKMIQ